MDDIPAGPASPGPRRPTLTVVIPVRDGGLDFERCLRGLRASHRHDYELVVVDDASADGSGDLARQYGARVLRHDAPGGPAAARNTGAEAATAPIIFFLDADVVVHPTTLDRALARFEADPALTALFGSYDDRPAAPGLVSQYRNLLHHYVHQRGEFRDEIRPAHTFWTGCGAMRTEAFRRAGGFDPRLYPKPAIEDIELGYRLTGAGHRIVLARDVLATHLKRWTFGNMVRTDLFRRGVPWMLLMLRSHVAETDLNVSREQRLSVLATGAGLLGLMLAPWMPSALSVTVAALLMVVALNRGFYGFLARCRGLGFAVACVPLHLVYFFCCGLSVPLALAIRLVSAGRTVAEPAPVPAPGVLRRDPNGTNSSPRPRLSAPRRRSRWTPR